MIEIKKTSVSLRYLRNTVAELNNVTYENTVHVPNFLLIL
jgi:hypothetical protein